MHSNIQKKNQGNICRVNAVDRYRTYLPMDVIGDIQTAIEECILARAWLDGKMTGTTDTADAE